MKRSELLHCTNQTREEFENTEKLYDLLKPGLKIKRNGRVNTSGGDKTLTGLYRILKRFFEETDLNGGVE